MGPPSRPVGLFRQIRITPLESALKVYERMGISLTDHPLAEGLKNCDSFDSVIAILQKQARPFAEVRESGDRIVKSLKGIVAILYHLPVTSSPRRTVNLPIRHVTTIFLAFAILFIVAKDNNASYDALVDLLELTEHFLSRLGIYTSVSPTLAMAATIIEIMEELLFTLALVTNQIKKKQPMKFEKKRLGENEVEAVLQRLDRLNPDEARMTAAPTLEVIYGLVRNMRVVVDDGKPSVDTIRSALVMIQQMVNNTNKLKRDKLQHDVRGWLSPPDPWTNHKIARELHLHGTAEWFVRGDNFLEWKWSGTLLWIHGKPGAGKSVLCSTIIEGIDAMRKSGLASIGFFYCDFGEDEKRNLHGLLSSLLLQLCQESDSYCEILSKFYSEHEHGSRQPSDNALVRCLKEILQRPGQAPVYLLVDALDECLDTAGLASPRANVLILVEQLIRSNLPNLRLCVTSRPEVDIKDILDPLTSLSVSLHEERGQIEDIANYIKSVITGDPKNRMWKAEDKQMVIDVLTNKADGMFRWVYCQGVYILGCDPGRIKQALAELPETLDETYRRTLQEIRRSQREFAHRLFQCVTAASRPLRVEELADFLAFDFDNELPDYNQHWRVEDPLRAVLSTCSSLLSVVNVEDFQVVQFTHFSAKEFLMSARLAESSDSDYRYHISLTAAHTLVARACLGILLPLNANVAEGTLQGSPLAEYAAEHWIDHALFENVSENVEKGMKQLFDPNKPHLAVWLWIHDPEMPYRRRTAKPLPPRGTSLHYVALCGLHTMIKFLITEHSQDVHSRAFADDSTPLHGASSRGHVQVVRDLLEHGADVTARDKNQCTPLHRASQGGHVQVARDLLDYGADVVTRDKNWWTPLHWASDQGSPGVVRLFLEHGADTTVRDKGGCTPLHWASQGGHAQVVLVLLERGVDAMDRDKNEWTPLHRASFGGHVQVARALLGCGVDVTAKDEDGWTPLHLASCWGHVQVALLLLESGAEATARDKAGWTPLHRASCWRHVSVARALIEQRGGLSAQDENEWTPLHWASHRGCVEVVNVLLEGGAVPTAEDKNRRTPLHTASHNGHVEVTRILLEHGAIATAKDKDGWTPLHWASSRGHLEVALVLLDRSADVTTEDNDGWSPLHRASDHGHTEITRDLLGYGADATFRDKNGWTPLHRASHKGHVQVVRVLLKHGVDATVQDKDGWSPLHQASQGGHVQVVRILLKHSVDATAQDKIGWTSLHRASQGGHVQVVRVLLEHGVDATAQDKIGWTPLHRASQEGHIQVVRVLIEHGVDATAQDKEGRSPLYRALFGRHVEVARVLFEHTATQNKRGRTLLYWALRTGHVRVAYVLLQCGTYPHIRITLLFFFLSLLLNVYT